jgi:hypothetical protein
MTTWAEVNHAAPSSEKEERDGLLLCVRSFLLLKNIDHPGIDHVERGMLMLP